MTIGLVYPDFVFCPQGESLFVFDLFPFDLLEEVAPQTTRGMLRGVSPIESSARLTPRLLLG